MNRSRLIRARLTPVVVPARPDSINSASVEDDGAEFARKYNSGETWTAFPLQPKWILELETGNGTVGIGESYRAAGREAMTEAVAPLLGQDVLRLDWRRLPAGDPRVYDAVEAAVLDAAGRLLGVPVCQLLGGCVRRSIPCSGWTGRRTPEDAARKAEESLRRGHRVFKFKCTDADPVAAWIERIAGRCGDRIRVLLDPNQRWHDVATTRRLMAGVPSEMMAGLEDPINRSDYAGHRELRETLGIPIFMHISVPYLAQGQRAEDLLTALRHDAADGFNFNGSMFTFVQLAETAALAGKPCWHGSEVDLGILEVAALHACAAASLATLPSDIFGELVREDDLISPGIRFVNGEAQLPDGPGFGVELDYAALERYRAGDSLAFGPD